jgi:hypothetical protein
MASNPHAAQFTTGPWFQDEQNPLHIVDAQGALIASTQFKPNAHLVASAPELYEVLTELLNIADVFKTVNQFTLLKAHKVLAKARGK